MNNGQFNSLVVCFFFIVYYQFVHLLLISGSNVRLLLGCALGRFQWLLCLVSVHAIMNYI